MDIRRNPDIAHEQTEQRLAALQRRVAERMTNANEVAAVYMNESMAGIYALNRNFAAYTPETAMGAQNGFTLWDEHTVRRLIAEAPDLMPYYPPGRAVNRGIDLAYGKRQITAQVRIGSNMRNIVRFWAKTRRKRLRSFEI